MKIINPVASGESRRHFKNYVLTYFITMMHARNNIPIGWTSIENHTTIKKIEYNLDYVQKYSNDPMLV